ncbi:hypothetical protein R1flu_022812 [Riccia fluitans]|uniref:DDE-1 domain-containing protein n=1 Tax=Riccia fluitans TaxID=41844 RepID=A0ABD1XQ91_9MARC
MDGSIKLKPLVINKSLKPRAFSHRHVSNPSNLEIDWYTNPKVWMNGVFWENFLQKFDVDMICHGRKQVILLVDNAPGHIRELLSLKMTTIVWLPPNTTATFQLMDAWIMKSFKSLLHLSSSPDLSRVGFSCHPYAAQDLYVYRT